jgi:hypothetical protein
MAKRDIQSGIYVGDGGNVSRLSVGGDVIGGDKYAGGAPNEDRQKLLAAVASIQKQLAELNEGHPGLRQDAGDELAKALDAGTRGDKDRLVEKLDSARGYLERLGQAVPAAVMLAHSVATLVAQASSLAL